MKVTYKVCSLGPREVPVTATLPDGSEVSAKATLVVVELMPVDGTHGTVSLVLNPKDPEAAKFETGVAVGAEFTVL